ncbi:hypothetical protein ACH5RR_023600 [Cinchona calisaya]|uniref:Uncharacterized protein n=1 Tax=Cinchona calisaya TaxID=153742 RepID=A0ABD2ZC99_9GENT
MDTKFNTILKMLSSNKNADLGEAFGTEKAALLPTPSMKKSTEKELITGVKEKQSKAVLPNPSKIELSMFGGENPRDWIRKCNKFFTVYQIEGAHSMELIEIYLEGKVDIWF